MLVAGKSVVDDPDTPQLIWGGSRIQGTGRLILGSFLFHKSIKPQQLCHPVAQCQSYYLYPVFGSGAICILRARQIDIIKQKSRI
jgi:hypothetical protein